MKNGVWELMTIKPFKFQMSMFKLVLKWVITCSIALPLLLFAAIMVLKVPIKPEEELLIKEGKVTSIFEGGVKDVCFRLEGDNNVYYINRGLENGLELNELRDQLMGNDVIIKYPDHWIMNKTSTIHLSILRIDGNTIYNETI